MSYILDALKKAESERERGAVPGLSSAQTNQSTFIHYGSDQRPWWLVALVLGVLLAVVVAVWAWRQATPAPLVVLTNPPATPTTQVVVPPEAKATAAAVQKSEGPSRAPVLAQTPAPVAAKASPLEAAASTVAHVQAKVAPASISPTLPATPVTPATPAKPTQTAVPVPPAAPVAPEPVSKPAPVATPIRSASGGVPMLSELPEAMRRQIPALNISGAVYSDSPPEWTLIINDQLMGKGSQVAPDVRLEEISGSSAVFNFKGQRFRMDR
jgi:general secretion pathway protein B